MYCQVSATNSAPGDDLSTWN